MKNVLQVTQLSVTTAPDGRKFILVGAYMPGNIELDPDDMAVLMDVLNEAASRFDGAAPADEPEPEEEKPAGRRRRSAEPEEKAEEPEPEPASPRRRRAAKDEPEEKTEEAPRRRRRAAEEPEEKAEGRRRRRSAEPEEPKGPTADDVAKAASEAAQKLGPKITAEIIGEFSDSGKLDGIPADKRQAFIDEINFELNGD